MKFNTLIIDKLNDFNSVLRQTPKKSSLIQFSDIINVCSAESSEGIQNPIDASKNPVNKISTSEQVIQVSPQELKGISALLSVFENSGNVQSTEQNKQENNTASDKNELVLTKDQLDSLFNVVLSQFGGYLPALKQFENADQANAPVKISFEDGTSELSITISAQQWYNQADVAAPVIADIFRLMENESVYTNQQNGNTGAQIFSATDEVDLTTMADNIKPQSDNGLPKPKDGIDVKQLFKVEILQQTINSNEILNGVQLPMDAVTTNKVVTNEPAVTYQDKNISLPEGNFIMPKSAIENLFSGTSVTNATLDQFNNITAQVKKDIPVEQILFGKNYPKGNSGESTLPLNIFEGLTEEEKSTLLKTFSAGNVLSMEFSSENVKPADPAHMQLRDFANEFVSMKETGEKLMEKTSVNADTQSKETAVSEKDPSVKVTIKDDQQSTKNVNDANTNNSDGTKAEKIIARDTQSNQQDDKDSGKRNTSELFKNTVLQNSSASGTEKTQFAAELKSLPNAAKTITKNDIIPEFSKVIQQGEKQTLTFQLSPENLGKVKLTVDMVANSLNAHIEVENDSVKQFIQSNINQLKQNFQSNGIQLSSVNISLADYGNQKNNKTFVPKKKYSQRYSNEGLIDKTTAPASRKSMGYNTYEFLA